MPSMSHYVGPEKLHRAIWCELFKVQEGYILYLKKWSQKSHESRMKQSMQEVDEIHSDIQRLASGGSVKEISESPEVANSAVKDESSKHEPASH